MSFLLDGPESMTSRKFLDPSELVIRGVYEIFSRNLVWAVWDGSIWTGLRHKFEWRLDSSEIVVHPIRFIEMLPNYLGTWQYMKRANGGLSGNTALFDYLMDLKDREKETDLNA